MVGDHSYRLFPLPLGGEGGILFISAGSLSAKKSCYVTAPRYPEHAPPAASLAQADQYPLEKRQVA